MKANKFFIAITLVTAFLAVGANAQSIVDPGISVYNYKHPNKAAQAKAKGKEMKTLRVANYNVVEQAGKYQRTRYASTTPKYAPRPTTLVIMREYKKEGIEINPLLSTRNYKTPNTNKAVNTDTTELADYYKTSEGSVYPTVD
jgi:hypothetical protein